MSNGEFVRPRRHGHGFLTGFIFGALIGGVVVFLLATKKGRKIMKIISEEGLDRVSKFEGKVEEYIDDDYSDDVVEDAVLNDEMEKEHPVRKAATRARRFFRKHHPKN